MSKPKISIGILAHVDAGKTSLTEQLLHVSGAIKSMGSVDDGTAQTDRLTVEKTRGISVQSAYSTIEWNNSDIFLIDTPGHVDFSAEVERVLEVIDVAVLVISAVEGLQAHTEKLWKVLQQVSIPVIFYINKVDRIGADVELVIEEIEKQFTNQIAILNEITEEASSDVKAIPLWTKENPDKNIVESLANINEEILNLYLSDETIAFNMLDTALSGAFTMCNLYPVISGSAKTGLNIKLLLNTISKYAVKTTDEQTAFSAITFAIENDPGQGKVTYAKILSGKLKPRDSVKNTVKKSEEKITLIKQYRGENIITINQAEKGDIVNLYGIKEVETGNYLGEPSLKAREKIKLHSPLLTVQIKPKQDSEFASLAEAMQLLNLEKPELEFEWFKEENELHVKVMGWIQMEVLISILKERFNIEAQFSEPTVIYKEKPAVKGFGYAKYTMPKPCWAIVRFLIEPGESGSGVIYESKISVDKIHRKYQNEIEKTIPKALKQGIKGWQVTDLKITLIDGEDHEIHSRPGDFIIATHMAILEGLKATGTTLLEPILKYKISASESLLGAITGDITQMRGSFDSPEMNDAHFSLCGLVPLSSSLEYPIQLSSRSGGKAKISTNLHTYQPCTDEQGIIRPFKGISPLDRSKFILKMRKAIQ